MQMIRTVFFVCVCTLLISQSIIAQDDWVTYQHDNRRSGVSATKLVLPIEKLWLYESPIPPQPAWTDTAKWDSYAIIKDLKSMRNFDPVFYTIAVGDFVYWGSSVEDAVHCMNVNTGKPEWSYYCNSPVRMPPTFDDGKLYFGSDDGFAYCIDAKTRDLVWKHKPSPDQRVVPNNGKLISLSPCRTGVMVQDGIAYFAMSLLPWDPSYVCAVDAKTGQIGSDGTFQKKYTTKTFQGAMLASPSKLYFPQGRQHPVVMERGSGEVVGGFGDSGQGGVFALLTPDEDLIFGGGQKKAGGFALHGFNAESRDRIASFPNASCMVVKDDVAYIHTGDELHAFDRGKFIETEAERMKLDREKSAVEKAIKNMGDTNVSEEKAQAIKDLESIKDELQAVAAKALDCILWRVKSDRSLSLIVAGDKLVSGGDNEVALHDLKTGKEIVQFGVEGSVYGLTAARGRLFASTDLGKIYAFGS